MWIILFLLGAWALFGIVEYRIHLRNLAAVPIRIHVNGTRGKSSVTRLIASGLRAGGVRTFAKTTGSAPRFIHLGGDESAIHRVGKPNIKEQMKVFRLAAQEKAEAVVVECMAIRPENQWVSEHKLIKSTIGVITNIRPDHLDEMGPTLSDVAFTLCHTIPQKGHLFTSEKKFSQFLEDQALLRKTRVHMVDDREITPEMMKGFSYIEHPENVALALEVCGFLGVDKEVALEGMHKVTPDVGALKVYRIKFFEKVIRFINAFAANDSESTGIIWKRMKIKGGGNEPVIVVVNNRGDRLSRSQQMGEFIAQLSADWFLLVGDLTKPLENEAIVHGLPPEKIANMGGAAPEEIFEQILELTPQRSLVVGIGNIGGMGRKIADYLKSRGRQV